MTEPKRVPVKLEDGTVGTVPEGELEQTIQAGGEVVSQDELHQAEVQAQYGDLKGEALAAGAGAARGLTFGLSDLALTELDPDLRDPLNALKEANPNASLAGEVAGAVAPTLLSGGGSGALSVGRAVRGLGVLPRGVSALGGLAERGAAGIVGDGATSLLGAAAQRGIALGARGAVEGSLYGAGHEVSEAALGDHEINAQMLMAGAKSGALAGLVVGGGLGAAEGLGGAALRRFVTPHEANETVREAAEAGGKPPTKLQQFLGEKADEQAWLALSPGKRASAVVDKTIPGGTKAVGRTLLDEGVIPTTAAEAARATPESIAETAQDRLAAWGKKIGDIRGGVPVEAPATTVGDQIRAAANEIKGGAMADMKRNLQKLSLDVDESLGVVRQDGVIVVNPKVSLDAMARERVALQKRAGFDKANPTIGQEALQSARAKMAEYEFKLIDEAATSAGSPETLAKLKEANLKYRHLTHAIDALEESEGRRAGNNFFSLRDTGSALAAAASGHGLVAIPAAFASKLARERGNQIAAAGLHQLSGRSATLQNVEMAIQKTRKSVDDSVGGFLSKPRAPVPMGVAKEPLAASFRGAVNKVAALASNPERVATEMATKLGPLTEHAPNISAAASTLEAKKVAFLSSKIPAGYQTLKSLQPQLERPRVSDLEMARFMRYSRAANEPLSVLSDLQHGRVTREAVETLQTLYPAIYDQVRTTALSSIALSKTKVPYQKQLQLGILFDAQTHPSLEPAFIRAMQEQWIAKKQQPGAIPSRPFSLGAASQATAAERLEKDR